MDQLAGLPIPASVLERDVLPARIPGYQPRLLDELGAMGEVAWVGRGSLGPRRRPRGPAAARAGSCCGPAARPTAWSGRRARSTSGCAPTSRRRGACFYRELFTASGARSDREVLDALWDLVWAGEVTNDTFAPLRALRWKRPAKDHRPRPGRLTALGPPEAAGRWSLVDDASAATGRRCRRSPAHRARSASTPRRSPCSSATACSPARRVAGEAVDGGFSAVYPVLRALEEAGRIRRGYFVDGLGAAQFALPGAVDRLRALRDQPGELAGEHGRVVHLLAAADPANPYGAAIPWPRRDEADRRPLQRAAGAYVALVDGAAVLYLDRGGTSLQVLPAGDDPDGAGGRPALPGGPRSRTGACASS